MRGMKGCRRGRSPGARLRSPMFDLHVGAGPVVAHSIFIDADVFEMGESKKAQVELFEDESLGKRLGRLMRDDLPEMFQRPLRCFDDPLRRVRG